MQGKDETEASWTVTLRPNRSLSREGLAAIIAIVAGLNLVAGLFFWVLGAWPIIGFMGLDVALVWWALRRNWSEAESFEQISIAGDKVTLLHKPWRGKATSQHFNRRWLRVELELDEARELVGRLFLAYRGRRQEIGAFLGAEDRRSLAQALRRAIAK
jgi:uncharacterized membrane protein